MDKCCHGVMIPSWAKGTGKSPYCNGCTSAADMPSISDQPRRVITRTDTCPKCGSKKFRYTSDWEYHCDSCGLDALD